MLTEKRTYEKANINSLIERLEATKAQESDPDHDAGTVAARLLEIVAVVHEKDPEEPLGEILRIVADRLNSGDDRKGYITA